MNHERTQYRVDIFGENYTLVSDEPAELVFNAVHTVNSLMKEITLKNAGVDIKKIAVLAALQLAGQLGRLKSTQEMSTAKHVELINKIANTLQHT